MEAEFQIEQIERYLKGFMSPDEKLAFETELESNPDLKKLILQHKYFLDGMRGMRITDMSSRLAAQKQTSKRRINIVRILAYAAGVLAVVCITYLLMRPSTTSLERLADGYYAPPLADLQRSEPGYEDKAFQDAMEAFNTENWNRAAEIFGQIKTDHPGYQQAQYFLAHALVGEKQYQPAKDLFDKMSVENGAYEQQAEWNRTLMELYLNYPQDKIIAALQRIADDTEHFYQDKAKELVQELKE